MLPDCAVRCCLEQGPAFGFGEELEGSAARENGVEVHGSIAGAELEVVGKGVKVGADAAVGLLAH